MKKMMNLKILLCATIFTMSSQLVNAKTLNLSTAKKVAETAEAFGRTKNWALSIAIVNEEGNLLYFQRGDNSYSGSIDAAIAKAKSANAFQRPSSAFAQGIKEGRLGLVSVPGVVAIEGGVPIMLDGQHVGAIGVSGAKATEDEEAALAAIKSIKKP
jgi:glc operon protein GlcG